MSSVLSYKIGVFKGIVVKIEFPLLWQDLQIYMQLVIAVLFNVI